MKNAIRILHVFGNLGHGGAESRIIDLYRQMDPARVQFDFVVHYEASETGKRVPSSDELMACRQPDYFDEAVKELGGHIYAVPRFKGLNLIDYRRAWMRLFEEHMDTWKAVQGHMTSTASIYLPIAKAAGVPMTIAHARSAGTDPGWKGQVTRFIRRPLQEANACDYSFACTKEAAEAVFGEKKLDDGDVKIIPNAIEVSRYAFYESFRKEVREEYGIGDALCIGHVGRFHYAKNHAYLLHVFRAVKERVEQEGRQAKLLLVGASGAYYEHTKLLAEELGIAQAVIFAGDRADVERFYAAMDVFVFPSRYEGLPGTVIEAQASGLPCLVSENVTHDVDAAPFLRHLSIEDDAAAWADAAMEELTAESLSHRAARSGEAVALLREAGFDVAQQAQQMMRFYETGSFNA